MLRLIEVVVKSSFQSAFSLLRQKKKRPADMTRRLTGKSYPLKIKQFFELLIQRDAENQGKFRRRIKLSCFD